MCGYGQRLAVRVHLALVRSRAPAAKREWPADCPVASNLHARTLIAHQGVLVM